MPGSAASVTKVSLRPLVSSVPLTTSRSATLAPVAKDLRPVTRHPRPVGVRARAASRGLLTPAQNSRSSAVFRSSRAVRSGRSNSRVRHSWNQW